MTTLIRSGKIDGLFLLVRCYRFEKYAMKSDGKKTCLIINAYDKPRVPKFNRVQPSPAFSLDALNFPDRPIQEIPPYIV